MDCRCRQVRSDDRDLRRVSSAKIIVRLSTRETSVLRALKAGARPTAKVSCEELLVPSAWFMPAKAMLPGGHGTRRDATDDALSPAKLRSCGDFGRKMQQRDRRQLSITEEREGHVKNILANWPRTIEPTRLLRAENAEYRTLNPRKRGSRDRFLGFHFPSRQVV